MDAPASSVEGGGEGQGQVEGNARAPLQALKTSLVQTRARLTKSLRGNFKKLMQQLLDKDSDSEEEDGQDDASHSPALWDIDAGSLLPIQLQHGACMHGNADSRRAVWLEWSNCHQNIAAQYADLLNKEVPTTVTADVAKDCHRTFPSYKRFAAPEGQASLRNVLLAYAAYDDAVAYCQGMNFVAGCLLMFLPNESEAFSALVTLMKERGLAGLYGNSMPLLQEQLWQLGKLLPPDLAAHMEVCGVVPVHFAASWLMTCFAADFPISFAARVLDVLLGGSLQAAMLKVALTLLQTAEHELLAMHDMEDILYYLKTTVPGWAEARLHEVLQQAFSTGWTATQLAQINCTEGKESVAQSMERIARVALDGNSPRAYHQHPAQPQTGPQAGQLDFQTHASGLASSADHKDALISGPTGSIDAATEAADAEAAVEDCSALDAADAELRATVAAPIQLGTSLGAYPAAELLSLHSSAELEAPTESVAAPAREQDGVGARLTLGSFGTPSRLRLSSGVSFADGHVSVERSTADATDGTAVPGDISDAAGGTSPASHVSPRTVSIHLAIPPVPSESAQFDAEEDREQQLLPPPSLGSGDSSVAVTQTGQAEQPSCSAGIDQQQAAARMSGALGDLACARAASLITGQQRQAEGQVEASDAEQPQQGAASSSTPKPVKLKPSGTQLALQPDAGTPINSEAQPGIPPPIELNWDDPRLNPQPDMLAELLLAPPSLNSSTAGVNPLSSSRPSALQTFASGPAGAAPGMVHMSTSNIPRSPFSCFLQQGMLPQPPTPKAPLDEAEQIWQHLVGSGPSGPSPSGSTPCTWGNAPPAEPGLMPCYTPSQHSQGMEGLPQGEQLPHGASTQSSSMLDVACEPYAQMNQRQRRRGSGDWSNISSGTLTRASSVQVPNGAMSSDDDLDTGGGTWYGSGAASTAGASRGANSTAAVSAGGYGTTTGAGGQDAANELHLAGEILRALCAQQLEQHGGTSNGLRSLRSTSSRRRRAASTSTCELTPADLSQPGTATASQGPSANNTLGQPLRLSAILGHNTDTLRSSSSKEPAQGQQLQQHPSRGTSNVVSPRSTCSNIHTHSKATFMHTAPASPTHPHQPARGLRAQCSMSSARPRLGAVTLNRTGSQPLTAAQSHLHEQLPGHLHHTQSLLGCAAHGSLPQASHHTLHSFISGKVPLSPKLRVMISDDHALAAPAPTPSCSSCDGHSNALLGHASEATTPSAGLTAHPPLPPKHANTRIVESHSAGADAAAHTTLHGRNIRSSSGPGTPPSAVPLNSGHTHTATCSHLAASPSAATQHQHELQSRQCYTGTKTSAVQQPATGGPFASRQLQAHLLDSFTASLATKAAASAVVAPALPNTGDAGMGLVTADCLAGSPGCTTQTVGPLASNKTLPASISYQ